MHKERDELVQRCTDELTRIEAEYDQITDLPKDGHRSSPSAQMQRLAARHRVVSRQLRRAQDAVEPFEQQYRDQVEGLVDALHRSRTYSDSFHAFRAVIGQVLLTPNNEDTALIVHFEAGAVRAPRGVRRTGKKAA